MPFRSARILPPAAGRRLGQFARGEKRLAFTLLELLVAVTILAVILLFSAQMTGSVGRLYSMGKARGEANSVSRALLDTMTGDLSRAIFRPDLAAFAERDDESALGLTFYCRRVGDSQDSSPEGEGLDAARAASIVEYVFYRSGAKQAYLARRSKACSWNSSANLVVLGRTNAIPSLDETGESLIYEGIVGMDWSYLREDGLATSRLDLGDGSRPVAICFSMAILDPEGMRLLKETGKVGDYLRIFNETGGKGISQWEAGLQSEAVNFPSRVISGTRLYERFVKLPSSTD